MMGKIITKHICVSVTGTTSDQVEMMQIDCEVINTQVLSVNELYIPTHMRPYTNSTRKLKGNLFLKILILI